MESASAVPEPGGVHGAARARGARRCRPRTAPRSASRAMRWARKGPIVLAPGYGNAARAFALDTVPKSFVAYLGEHDYDVWLLDYRASPDLPSSFSQFTVDDIALRDWPAAIDTVRRETGADSVQAMGHCVGGLSLFMAIGGGMEGLRSATFSALAGHPVPTPGNKLRAGVRMATVFKALGHQGPEHRLRPQVDPRPRGRGGDEGPALPPRLRRPGGAAHLLHLRRRLRLREHRRGRRCAAACRASSATATSRSSSTSR